MKSKLLNRDYPLSETKMSNDEKNKSDTAAKEMDKKKILGKKVDALSEAFKEEHLAPSNTPSVVKRYLHKKYIDELKK